MAIHPPSTPLKLGLFATGACALFGADSRPNIIYILSDDHTHSAISAYGGRYAKMAPTPNIDRIASEGVRLDRMFCTNAICGPSRACILTGKYSHKNGFYQNEGGIVFDGDQPTFPKQLRQAGYTTALIGKWHLFSEPQGFDFYKIHTDGQQQGRYWNPRFSENGRSVQEKGYATDLTGDFALDWLENKRNRQKPFCLLVHFKAPHRPCEPHPRHANFLKEYVLPVPNTFDDDCRTREQTAGKSMMTIADYLSRGDLKLPAPDQLSPAEQKKWLRYGDGPSEPWTPEGVPAGAPAKMWKYQNYVKDYLRCVRAIDENVGRILNYLKENRLEENTIVIYVGDQGFYLGEHGWYDKRWMYETSFKMPCLIRYPREIPAGQKNNAMTLNIDFAPTLLDYAGAPIAADIQGKSMRRILSGEKSDLGRDAVYYAYYEYPKWHHVQPHYGIRTDRYKLIHFYYDIDQWEFYDMEKDPDELTNRIDDPACAKTIAALKQKLKSLQQEFGDDIPLEQRREMTRRYLTNY